MTRTLRILVAATAVILLAFLLVSNTGASDEPQVVKVNLRDYRVDLSQFSVAPGKTVRFIVENDGATAHQLTIEPWAGQVDANVPADLVVAPNTSRTLDKTFSPGVYRVECNEWDHAERGMVTALAVGAAPRRTFPLQMDLIVPLLGLFVGATFIISDALGLRLVKSKGTTA